MIRVNTLDLCCRTDTNPIYLAKKGFDITALDISDKAHARKKTYQLRGRTAMYIWDARFI